MPTEGRLQGPILLYNATGDGYKRIPKKEPYGEVTVELYRKPDGRAILSFGWPWEYYLDDMLPRLRVDANGDKLGLCVDMGAGFVIPNDEIRRVLIWIDGPVVQSFLLNGKVVE